MGERDHPLPEADPSMTGWRWAFPVSEVSRALGGDGRSTGRCPAHMDRAPSLSVGIGREGKPLVHCFAGCGPRDVLEELERLGLIVREGNNRELGRPHQAPTSTKEPGSAEPNRSEAKAKAARIWRRARPITANDPTGRYLVARGCALPAPGSDLRWLAPNPPEYTETTMVAKVTAFEDASRCLTLHFTPIRKDGVRGERRLMASLPSKGVVRLIDDAEAVGGLFVAEGIETVLAGPQPAFACLNAGNLAALPVLPGFEALTVHVDNDPAGRQAGEKCAARWHTAGVEVRLFRPGDAHGH